MLDAKPEGLVATDILLGTPVSDTPEADPDVFVVTADLPSGPISEALDANVVTLIADELAPPPVLAAAAVTAAVAGQCNDTDNAAAALVECDVTVINNLDLATGEDSSTVIFTECHGFPGEDLEALGKCNTTTTNFDELTTTITQCNGTGNKGGSTVICTVNVINNITGESTATDVSTNQCNGSGADGVSPVGDPLLCDPFPASVDNATVTQCNGSGNGGGAPMRVRCTVEDGSNETMVIPVTIDQCNGSANGGGATIICSASIRNVVTPADEGEGGRDDTPADEGEGGRDDTSGDSDGTNDGPGGGGGGDDTSTLPALGLPTSALPPLAALAAPTPLVLASGLGITNGISGLADERGLPATGIDVRLQSRAGIFMLLLGAGLIVLSRRRHITN